MGKNTDEARQQIASQKLARAAKTPTEIDAYFAIIEMGNDIKLLRAAVQDALEKKE